MRALMAIVLFAGGILGLDVTADAQSSHKRITKSYRYKYEAQPRLTERERLECERARQEDPAGEFKGFPCWAREAFGRGRRSWD
jgi:hypothetical protein